MYIFALISHARDNKLHVWAPIHHLPSVNVDSALAPTLPTPTHLYSLDVNALNYCRFSLYTLSNLSTEEHQPRAWLAVPNLIESAFVDIWALPSRDRVDAAIGTSLCGQLGSSLPIAQGDGRGGAKTGIVMSIHLFDEPYPSQSTSTSIPQPRLLTAYEDGSVVLWTRKEPLLFGTSCSKTVEGKGWEAVWNRKLHVESVMGMAVSRDRTLAVTVSADHIIGRYTIPGAEETSSTAHRTKQMGNAAITIRDDGRVCITAGWDGKLRIYSTKTIKLLGTLDYHKESCQTVTFARTYRVPTMSTADIETSNYGDGDEDEMDDAEKEMRGRWVISGGKDGRVVIWELGSFERT